MKFFFIFVLQIFLINQICYSFVVLGKNHKIIKRDIGVKVDTTNLFEIKRPDSAIPATITTVKPSDKGKLKKVVLPGNDLFIGTCNVHDKMLYIDNTVIINDGSSTLNGTIEIYIDAAEPIKITCIQIYDQITDGTGGKPSYNSGGLGFDWVKIDVQGQYGKGFHFKTYVFGVVDLNRSTTTTLSPLTETTAKAT